MSLFGRRSQPAPSSGEERSSAEREAARIEREAARIERERRRAQREGRPLPDAPPPRAPAPEPVAPTPEPVAYEPEPVAYEPEPQPIYEPPPVHHEPEPVHEDPVPEHEPAYEPVGAPARGAEAPAGVRRVGAPSVRDLPEVAGPRPARPVRQRGVPRSHRGARRVVAIVLLALIVAAGWFAYRVFQPFAGGGDSAHPIVVTVPPGASAGDVGHLLADKGVIDSAFFFNLRAKLAGRRGDLKAGTFTLKRDMSYAAALDVLTRNPASAPVFDVTIPEGRSIAEAAPLVRTAGVKGSYVAAATRNPRTIPGLKGLGVPKGTRTLEGFLFPATYQLKRGATADKLVGDQLQAFRSRFAKLDLRAARRKNLTPYDVLIIASMIEREAQVAKDRKLISAVIYNRLRQHIPLGIDATLRYRLNNWSRPLRQSELQTSSAFNTRLHQGLPPTPIGSPGLASIQAALAPAHVSYLYYVVKPCGNGAHAFSSTDAQFQRDVAAYNKKRAQLGGKDPSHC